MNKEELKNINDTQEEYENILIEKIESLNSILKTINFTSPTGTGKTKMMADIINKMNNDYFFAITTLSKGQLHHQIREEIKRFCSKNNYLVYGLNDYTKNTILQEEDILSLIPKDKKIIWFRDEGHINTNRWAEILENLAFKTINFSATNNRSSDDDVKCNFNHTMMLRTVIQSEGTPVDALEKLLEVKKQHKNVKNYNPCAIFRILDDNILELTIEECKKRNLLYINITEEDYNMSDICKDDNKYDVIINKFKIIEGIDIRRSHVLYMTNEPKNPATTIQVIGRCRRNALLYRDDIDILAKENEELLKNTRVCYVFYNVKGMNIEEDENGDLVSAFCPLISVQDLKSNTVVKLKKGIMSNGLEIYEADKLTGTFRILETEKYGIKTNQLCTLKKQKLINFYETALDTHADNNYYRYWHNNFSVVDEKIINIPKISEIKIINNTEKYVYCKEKITLKPKFHIPFSEILKEKTKEFRIIEEQNKFLIEVKEKKFKIIDENIFEIDYDYYMLKNYNEPKNSFNEFPIFLFENKLEARKKIQELVFNLHQYGSWYRIEFICSVYNENHFIKETAKPFVIYVDKLGIIRLINSEIILNEHHYFLIKCSKKNFYTTQKLRYEKQSDNRIASFCYSKKIIDDLISSNEYQKYNFKYLISNEEDVTIGINKFRPIKEYITNNYNWVEDKSVTSQISKNTKLNQFILYNYKEILNKTKKFYYNFLVENSFSKKMNSMLGYMVEYYSKYLFYGIGYFKEEFFEAYQELQKENSNLNEENLEKEIALRACMIKYRKLMKNAYGNGVIKVVSGMSIKELLNEKNQSFKNKIYELAEKTKFFLLENFNIPKNDKIYEENLSIGHISALADYINKNTIIDIKCTGYINEKYIKQILTYHFLSTKRSDLNIKYLIVYDAVANRYIKINIKTGKIETNY